jgi:hypothetical protein
MITKIIICCCCCRRRRRRSHGLGPLACSDSELTSEATNFLDISAGLLRWVISSSQGQRLQFI